MLSNRLGSPGKESLFYGALPGIPIQIDPAAREKSAFTTHCGLHDFVRMPFGMCNASKD